MQITNSEAACDLAERKTQALSLPAKLFLLLLAYFACQVMLRVLTSNSADLDESEQLLLTQQLHWGYGPQLPLYTWIQTGFFRIFGVSIFSLALLKGAMLLATYVFTYLSANLITRRPACGVAAALSLLFIPQVAWESQRDLTHSVLASLLATATLYYFLRLSQDGRTRFYVLMGICGGLGILSKYNYAIFLAALLAAAVSVKELRGVVLDRRMLITLGIVLALFLPNAIWMAQHPDLAFAATAKFRIKESAPWLPTAMKGLSRAGVSMVTFAGPMLLVYCLLFGVALMDGIRTVWTNCPYGRLIVRTLLFVGATMAVLVLVFGVTGFRERWVQPLLVCVAVLGGVTVRDHLSPPRLKRMSLAAAAVALLVAVVIPGRILWAERLDRSEPLSHPLQELAAQALPVLSRAPVVLAEDRVLGGNLRLHLPHKTVVTPEFTRLFKVTGPPLALVWDATANEKLPSEARVWANSLAVIDWTKVEPQYFIATYKYHHARTMKIGVLLIQ